VSTAGDDCPPPPSLSRLLQGLLTRFLPSQRGQGAIYGANDMHFMYLYSISPDGIASSSEYIRVGYHNDASDEPTVVAFSPPAATEARLFPSSCAQARILLYLQELQLPGLGTRKHSLSHSALPTSIETTPATVSHNVQHLSRPANTRLLVIIVFGLIANLPSHFNMMLLEDLAQPRISIPCP
jgi:hypothetical protein